MTKNELREKLADIDHEQWSKWETYRETAMRCGSIQEETLKCWKQKRETPYADLQDSLKATHQITANLILEIVWPLIEASRGDGRMKP